MGKTIFNNSKELGFLVAVTIASVNTLVLYFMNLPKAALIVVFLLIFFLSYFLFKIIFDFLIFKEVSKINTVLKKIRREDLGGIGEIKTTKKSFLNPLGQLNQDIYMYAALKQREIDNLKKMAAFRREFLADVSHELKTPIFAAQGYVHTLIDGAMEDDSVREKFLQKAAKSLDGLDLLVQDLLVLSQMETGEITMHFEDFDMAHLTKEIFEQVETKADERNIQLHISENAKKKVMVHADVQRIGQVMTNLISNAIKYGRDGGNVMVDFRKRKNYITVFVKDDGSGIPEEHLPRIFERFYRVDKSRSKDKGGTGLGLAIVKHILEAHKIKIQVSSQLGEGTTFYFNLPKKKKPATQVGEESHVLGHSHFSPKDGILIFF